MTDEQKDILISKMLQTPGELSDSEVTAILEDDELRDIYSLSHDLKAAKRPAPQINPASEWQKLRPRLATRRRLRFNRIFSIVATIIGILLLAATVVQFISTRHPDNQLLDPSTHFNPTQWLPNDEHAADVEEMLRIQEARVENDLARQHAYDIIMLYRTLTVSNKNLAIVNIESLTIE